MDITGMQFIDGRRVAASGETFSCGGASAGQQLPYRFFCATAEEVRAAAVAAAAAYPVYRTTSLEERALFLEAIAEELDLLDDGVIATVMAETALPEARVRGERVRTSNQFRLFARVVRRGDFLGARIDSAMPDREPVPRSDIRQYRIGIGPVAVFGAGNFPLAFSVAGGDTASALAAGCPVVVKAHSGHPATSDLVAQAIVRAARRCGMPTGVFGMLFGDGSGGTLVTDGDIKGVAFTGSRRGGLALADMAARRPEPIPFFAEMSGINPVLILPGALTERSAAIAAGVAGSATLGGGQFCTKPGLVLGCAGESFERFSRELAEEMAKREAPVMLSGAILANYRDGLARMGCIPGVERIACGQSGPGSAEVCLFRADPALLEHPEHPLEEEVFGPATVVVAVHGPAAMVEFTRRLQGHLTASIFAGPGDEDVCASLLEILERRVGRIIFNDYPTGVEVCDAMVHGGPFPASSDSRFSSVGSLAIERFLRPVCYQGCPDRLLPFPLRNSNPLGIPRLVNGRLVSAAEDA